MVGAFMKLWMVCATNIKLIVYLLGRFEACLFHSCQALGPKMKGLKVKHRTKVASQNSLFPGKHQNHFQIDIQPGEKARVIAIAEAVFILPGVSFHSRPRLIPPTAIFSPDLGKRRDISRILKIKYNARNFFPTRSLSRRPDFGEINHPYSSATGCQRDLWATCFPDIRELV